MVVAIPLLPLLGGVATSQSTIVNNQTQSGAVTSSQTLDVDTVTDQTTATTTSTGNTISGAVDGDALDVQSTQVLQSDVTADTVLNVNTQAGQAISLSTVSTGNAAEADAVDGGALTGNFSQDAGSGLIRANTQVEGASGQAGDGSATAAAYANTQGLGVEAGSINATVTQSSSATVEADGGADLQYSPGSTTSSSVAVSNNITATGTNASSQTLVLNQSMTGDHTQATKFVAFGNGQTIDTSATASANNISISNDGGPLDVTASQDNEGYVRAQSEATAYEFGSSTSTASGVGNSLIAAESGRSLVLSNTQTNSGAGIDVIASSGGNTGYDLAATATAMGNAATGYACTLCGGTMSVTNSQTNAADVGARSSINVDGQARSVTGVATAVGNSATFYVSKPGG
jgi:hypothetical protein